MVKVCVHHPLSPYDSKRCMEKMQHKPKWIDELALPFSKSTRMTAWAIENLSVDGEITEEEHEELYDQHVGKERKFLGGEITIHYTDEPVFPNNPFNPHDPRYRPYLHGSMMRN